MDKMLPLRSWETLFEYEIDDFKELIDISLKQGLNICRTDDTLWVFWRQDDDDKLESPQTASSSSHWEIRKKIKDGLLGFIHHGFTGVLVQFWVPMTIGGQRFLTTSNQPFGLGRIVSGLCKYRKHCMSYKISLDGDSEEELGVPGRVFLNKCVESTPKVRYYSKKEYPHLDIAVNNGINGSVAVPMFEPGQSCVGVLELVSSWHGPEVFALCLRILEAINLKPSWQFCNHVEEDVKHTMDNIEEKLQMVCTTHELPLAQTWIPCRPSSVVSYGDSQEKSFSDSDYLTVWDKNMLYDDSSDDSDSDMLNDFNRDCRYHNFRKGQGLVGMALLSPKAFFCRDITKLPINEYPLAHHARYYDLIGCFVICLRDSTSNQDYVLEFFLPPSTDDIDTKDLQDFLDKLLATLKKHFQGYKIASGKELGEELSVEVVKFSMYDESDSFKICQTPRPPPEALENEREPGQLTVEINIENLWNVSGAEQNDVVVTCLEKTAEISERVLDEKVGEELSVVEINSHSNDEKVQLLDEQLTMETVRKYGLNVLDTKQNQVNVTSFKTCAVKTSKRKQETTGSSFRLEDIQQCYGMKLADAAERLDVSRSTFKRVCREHGIKRWQPKRKKVNNSSNLKQLNEFVQCDNEQNPDFRIDPLCTHLPPKQATVAVTHTITNATPIQDVRTVTVKATYGDDIFRFQLPFSSKMADLVAKVNIRLPLKDVPLSIKYEDEDGDWVTIACDEDLEECMGSSRSLGKTTIKIFVKTITNQAP